MREKSTSQLPIALPSSLAVDSQSSGIWMMQLYTDRTAHVNTSTILLLSSNTLMLVHISNIIYLLSDHLSIKWKLT
jgi:hypothetical protein